MDTTPSAYPLHYDVDYPESLNRWTTAFRLILALPLLILLALLGSTTVGARFLLVGGTSVALPADRAPARPAPQVPAVVVRLRARACCASRRGPPPTSSCSETSTRRSTRSSTSTSTCPIRTPRPSSTGGCPS